MVGDESSFLRRIAYSTAFLKAHSPSLAPPPSAPAPQCVPKTVSPSVKALARNPPPHSASSHYRLSPDLKSCRWLSCVKIQTPPEQFPDYAHLNPPKTSSALSFIPTSFFSPLGILNSPHNLSQLRRSLHNGFTVSNVFWALPGSF